MGCVLPDAISFLDRVLLVICNAHSYDIALQLQTHEHI